MSEKLTKMESMDMAQHMSAMGNMMEKRHQTPGQKNGEKTF